jgi:hypothetical protein
LPVIGSISLTVSEAMQKIQKRRHKQFAGAFAGLIGVFLVLMAIEVVSVGTIV